MFIKTVLRGAGHWVRFVSDVASAIKAGEEEKFDLLLCDIGLPDGSGLDVVYALTKRNAVAKAIAISGFGMADDIER